MVFFHKLQRDFVSGRIKLNDKDGQNAFMDAMTGFFVMLDRCVKAGKVFGDSLTDIAEIMEHADSAFQAFDCFVTSGNHTHQVSFKRDYYAFCDVLRAFALRMQSLLNDLCYTSSVSMMTEFSLAVSCCSGSFSVSQTRIAPFYQMRLIPIF